MNTEDMKLLVTPDTDPRKNADHLFLYRGIHCRQTRRVFDALDRLKEALVENPPKTIVEIGTFHGAFTRLLRDHEISEGTDMATFDIDAFKMDPVEGVTHHVCDIWKSSSRTLIKDLADRPGRCLVFCDGGNKALEIKTFCSYLKPGDLILGHDYAKDVSVMSNKDIIGNWPPEQYELQFEDIKFALELNNFEPFLENEMQKAMWGCFVKKQTPKTY